MTKKVHSNCNEKGFKNLTQIFRRLLCSTCSLKIVQLSPKQQQQKNADTNKSTRKQTLGTEDREFKLYEW